MELTKEQIQKIETFLDKKRVDLIDFRVEIFDHIASEIEKNMGDKNNFESVFNQVTKKWSEELNLTSSFRLGLTYNAPKIVIRKAKKFYKKKYLSASLFVLVAFIPVFILLILDKNTYKEIFTMVQMNTGLLSGIMAVIIGLVSYKSRMDRVKTVYSFLIKTQELITVILIFVLLCSFVEVYMFEPLIVLIPNVVYVIFLYNNHLKEKSKYRLIVQ